MSRPKPPEGFTTENPDHKGHGEASSWYQLVGPLYHSNESDPSKVSMAFYSEPRYISSMGRVHGGMISSFFDYLLFNTAHSAWGDTPLATLSLNIDFISACPADTWVIGHGQVTRAGSRVAFVRGEIHVGAKVIAQATGTFQKLDRR